MLTQTFFYLVLKSVYIITLFRLLGCNGKEDLKDIKGVFEIVVELMFNRKLFEFWSRVRYFIPKRFRQT